MLATVAGLVVTSVLAVTTVNIFIVLTSNGIAINEHRLVTSNRPSDCQDLIREGRTIDGYYAVYPGLSDQVEMIYCSQDDGMEGLSSDSKLPRNCLDLLHDGVTSSGVNVIYPNLNAPMDPLLVFCDQETDGGGWTLIQKRSTGFEDFYRPWSEYAKGFGRVEWEHYLGNSHIAALTGQSVNELRVELQDWDGVKAFAHYKMFHVDNASTNYQMKYEFNGGTAGNDSLLWNSGQPFSTYDADHDESESNCAEVTQGGWWYGHCTWSNLNGRYYPSADISRGIDGIFWYHFRGYYYSLKATTMKIRPVGGVAAST